MPALAADPTPAHAAGPDQASRRRHGRDADHDQRDLKPHRCRRHPAIRLMFLLAQAMPRPDAPGTQRGIGVGEMWPRPDDLGPTNLVLQPPEPVGAPAGQPGSVLKLGNGDKRDNCRPAFKYRPLGVSQAPNTPVSMTTGPRKPRFMRS
jgi:hypothetical protein